MRISGRTLALVGGGVLGIGALAACGGAPMKRAGDPEPGETLQAERARERVDAKVTGQPLGEFGGLTRIPLSLSHSDLKSTSVTESKSRTISLGAGAGVGAEIRNLVFSKLPSAGAGAGVLAGVGWTKSTAKTSTSGTVDTVAWGYSARPQALMFAKDVTSLSGHPEGFASIDDAIVGTRTMHGINPYDRAADDKEAMSNHVALAYRTDASGKVRVYTIDAEQELGVVVDSLAITDAKVGALIIDGSVYRPGETIVGASGETARLFEYASRASLVSEVLGGPIPTQHQSLIEGEKFEASAKRAGDASPVYNEYRARITPKYAFYPNTEATSRISPREFDSLEGAVTASEFSEPWHDGGGNAIVSVQVNGTKKYFGAYLEVERAERSPSDHDVDLNFEKLNVSQWWKDGLPGDLPTFHQKNAEVRIEAVVHVNDDGSRSVMRPAQP